MPTRLLLPRSQVVGLDGRPVSGAKLYTYASGTSTPKAVFADAALTVAHANPVIADAAGRFPAMFLTSGDYRTVLTDAADAVIASDDPVEGGDASTSSDVALAGLAARRNRIVNPAMQISQERGTALVDCTSGFTYVVDQWLAQLSTTPGGTLRMQQVASATPGGSPFRLRATVQAADAAIAAGDTYSLRHIIEGHMVADALFGAANARQILLRFGVRSSAAGTFGLRITNDGAGRSWVGTFTISASEVNTDVLRTLVIPGDTVGTWLKDAGIGMILDWTLAAGATFQGVLGWQAGNVLTTAAQTNFMATGSATFELFDVGLYVDTLAAEVFPPFEIPDFGEETQRCQRYYWHTFPPGTPAAQNAGTTGAYVFGQIVTGAANTQHAAVLFPIEMRSVPVMTSFNPSAANAQPRNITAGADYSSITLSATRRSWSFSATSPASGTAGQLSAVHVAASARL